MIDLESAKESKIRFHAFTVKDYYKMAEVGILCEDDRVELIEGEIIEMPPIGSPHASVVDNLTGLFARGLTAQQAVVRIQGPVRLNDTNEPVPDVLLLKPRPGGYQASHPAPQDVFLAVEVADTSITYDRRVKLPLYARQGIAEYWIVDLNSEAVEVYRAPAANGYGSTRIAALGETVAPLAFPALEFKVDDILG